MKSNSKHNLIVYLCSKFKANIQLLFDAKTFRYLYLKRRVKELEMESSEDDYSDDEDIRMDGALFTDSEDDSVDPVVKANGDGVLSKNKKETMLLVGFLKMSCTI